MKTTQTQQSSQHSNQDATVSAAPGVTINVAALGVPVTVSTQPKPAMATKPAPAKKVEVDYTPKLQEQWWNTDLFSTITTASAAAAKRVHCSYYAVV